MKSVAYALIISANVVGGASYLAAKIALEGLPPAQLTLLRTIVATLCAGILLAARGQLKWRFDRGATVRVILVGVCSYGGALLLGNVGLQLGGSSANASILILLEPASILFFSWILLRETLRPRQMLGIGLALLGAMMLASGKAPDEVETSPSLWGNVVLAVHGVLWGLYTPLIKPIALKYSGTELTFYIMLFSLFLLVPGAAYEATTGAGESLDPEKLQRAIVVAVILGAVVSFGATLFWNLALRSIKASSIAPFIFLQPLTGGLLGVTLGEETLTPAAQIGSVAIVAGIVLVMLPGRRVTGEASPA